MVNVIHPGDLVVWNDDELIFNPIAYGKRIMDYGNGPFEVAEVDQWVTIKKDGVKIMKNADEPMIFAKYWFTKIEK